MERRTDQMVRFFMQASMACRESHNSYVCKYVCMYHTSSDPAYLLLVRTGRSPNWVCYIRMYVDTYVGTVLRKGE